MKHLNALPSNISLKLTIPKRADSDFKKWNQNHYGNFFFLLSPTGLMIDLLNFISTFIDKEDQLPDLKDRVSLDIQRVRESCL